MTAIMPFNSRATPFAWSIETDNAGSSRRMCARCWSIPTPAWPLVVLTTTRRV